MQAIDVKKLLESIASIDALTKRRDDLQHQLDYLDEDDDARPEISRAYVEARNAVRRIWDQVEDAEDYLTENPGGESEVALAFIQVAKWDAGLIAMENETDMGAAADDRRVVEEWKRVMGDRMPLSAEPMPEPPKPTRKAPEPKAAPAKVTKKLPEAPAKPAEPKSKGGRPKKVAAPIEGRMDIALAASQFAGHLTAYRAVRCMLREPDTCWTTSALASIIAHTFNIPGWRLSHTLHHEIQWLISREWLKPTESKIDRYTTDLHLTDEVQATYHDPAAETVTEDEQCILDAFGKYHKASAGFLLEVFGRHRPDIAPANHRKVFGRHATRLKKKGLVRFNSLGRDAEVIKIG